jgi:septal ring factor EnvC (AmiA/AmiB activator)
MKESNTIKGLWFRDYLWVIAWVMLFCPVTAFAEQAAADLDNTRTILEKWIESQRLISKERKDWQQGKDILEGQLELSKKEIATLTEKTVKARADVEQVDNKRSELSADNDRLKTVNAQLDKAVTSLEKGIRAASRQIPEPIMAKLLPLYQRIPEDPNKTRVSVAERYQNVLGILNELNKANNEITVSYEVHTLSSGKPCEVKAIYVGLAQAYYVSASGDAGIGHPTPDGWKWEPSKTAARDIFAALEILQGKQTPAFVPLPVKIN